MLGLPAILQYVSALGHKPRWVHLLFGEGHWPVSLGLRACGYHVSCIFYYVQHQDSGRLRGRLSRLALWLLKNCQVRLFSLEPPTAMKAGSFSTVLFDPSDLQNYATQAAPATATWGVKRVVIAGHINRRKLVTEIIDALAQISREPGQSIELRLVGKVDPAYLPAIQTALAAAQSATFHAVLMDERVSGTYLRSELETADIVSALYSDHYGSSGMVVNAAAFRRPVLFFPIGALESLARCFPYAHFPSVRSDIASSIRAALLKPSHFTLSEASRDEFVANRSPERFAETFHATIEQYKVTSLEAKSTI
jgi:hypothetical protein